MSARRLGGSRQPKQSSLANIDDAADDLYDVAEIRRRTDRWDRFNAAEAYLKGNLSINILAREIGVSGRDGNYYFAIFQKRVLWRDKLKWFAKPRFWRHNGVACGGPYWDDQSVLISDAETIKEDECVAGIAQVIPSFVRLQSLNEPNCIRAAILPKFLESLCFEFGSMPEDRETEIFRSVGLKASRKGYEEVQSGSAIMDNISDDGAPIDRDRFMRFQHQLVRAVRVYMSNEIVRVTSSVSFCESIELCEVYLCPFYFGARSEPWINISDGHVSPSHRGLRIL